MTLAAPLARTSAPDPSFAVHRDIILNWWRQLS
jgi:hypothetical protein